jgi:antitoxin component YwqK of YwqJK toxin-antitoxin module
MNETISAKDRLEKYTKTDFLTSQPYKQVVRIYSNDAPQKTSILTTYHPNGYIYQYLEVVNARAFGSYKQWHSNGQLEISATVIGGPAGITELEQQQWIFDKKNFVWDESGNLISTFNYEKGQLQDEALYYHANGNIKRQELYHNNELDGVVSEFNEEGMLTEKMSFKNGSREGESIGYWSPNTVSFVEKYKNGLLLNGEYFDEKSKLLSKIHNGNGIKTTLFNEYQARIEFKNGQPEGNVEKYYNSALQSITHVKNGKKHGEETEYYADGETPKLTVHWAEDKLQGTVKTWYDNGNIESQKDMYDNKKNGVSTAWYRNETIMLIEEYEHNILVKGAYYKINENIPVSTILKGNGTATLYDEAGNFLKSIKYQNGLPETE